MRCKRTGGISTKRTMRGRWVRCTIRHYLRKDHWTPECDNFPRRRAGARWMITFTWVGKVADIDVRSGTVRMSQVKYISPEAKLLGFYNIGMLKSQNVFFDTCSEITEKELVAWSM